MKILSFGHIPLWAGGKQSSGLSNVIYHLAKNMARCKDVEVNLAATDVFKPFIYDDELTILGWSKGKLIKYAFAHPIISFKWLLTVVYSRIKFGRKVSILGYFFKGVHLAKSLKIVRPDVVHLHGMSACIYDKLIPVHTRIIVTMHGLIGTDSTIPHQASCMKMEKAICESFRYTFVAFIATQLKNDFIDLYHNINSNSVVAPNAYDGNVFYYVEPQTHDLLTLVSVASLSDNKGQHRVLEAIAKSGLRCKYICIGLGTDELIARNRAIAEKYHLDYEFIGKKSPVEIRELFAKVDYMILPSSTEGFGLVFLESIACGVPVILPKHLAIVKEPNIIKPGINALLTEDSSAEAIVKVLNTLQNYNFCHHEVSQSISGYTWKLIAQQYVNLIKNKQ